MPPWRLPVKAPKSACSALPAQATPETTSLSPCHGALTAGHHVLSPCHTAGSPRPHHTEFPPQPCQVSIVTLFDQGGN